MVVEYLVPHDLSGKSRVQSQHIFDQMIVEGKVLQGNVLRLPQFDLKPRRHNLRFGHKVLISQGELRLAQPNLMDDLGDNLGSPLFADSHKLLSRIEHQHARKRNSMLGEPSESSFDVFARQSPPGGLQLLFIDGLPALGLDDDGRIDNDCSPRHIPNRTILLNNIQQFLLLDLASHQLQQGHQKDEPIFEVASVDVSQVKLGNVPKTLHRKHPHMVQHPLQLLQKRVRYHVLTPVKNHHLAYRKPCLPLVLKRYEGPHHVSRAADPRNLGQTVY